MQEKLPFGKFLIPFGYQGPYVAVRLEDKDNPVFGGKAWWIYSRWLDIASDFKDPQDDYGKKILEVQYNSILASFQARARAMHTTKSIT